jgi:hypothetical protein
MQANREELVERVARGYCQFNKNCRVNKAKIEKKWELAPCFFSAFSPFSRQKEASVVKAHQQNFLR